MTAENEPLSDLERVHESVRQERLTRQLSELCERLLSLQRCLEEFARDTGVAPGKPLPTEVIPVPPIPTKPIVAGDSPCRSLA